MDAASSGFIGREVAGRYRILTKLGEGGMGAVYKAEQISLKRTVALKVLRPELSAEPGMVRRFNAEAELAARLSHPNTVTLFDFGQDADGCLFIAMEYLEGVSLREVLTREGALVPGRALAICEQLCASLADAHSRGIVHRDLKPDNVMLVQRGRQTDVVRVLDFGIAKLREEQGDVTAMPMTRAGDLIGTPQYMAPEQIRGETVDARTDVYALGAMLYEMVTGRLPFEAPTLMAILSKHLTEMPVPPRERRPDLRIPPSLSQLIMDALQKEPARRPATMDAFADRLARLVVDMEPRGPAATAAQGGAGAVGFGVGSGRAPRGDYPPAPALTDSPPPGVPLLRTPPPGQMRASSADPGVVHGAGVGSPTPGHAWGQPPAPSADQVWHPPSAPSAPSADPIWRPPSAPGHAPGPDGISSPGPAHGPSSAPHDHASPPPGSYVAAPTPAAFGAGRADPYSSPAPARPPDHAFGSPAAGYGAAPIPFRAPTSQPARRSGRGAWIVAGAVVAAAVGGVAVFLVARDGGSGAAASPPVLAATPGSTSPAAGVVASDFSVKPERQLYGGTAPPDPGQPAAPSSPVPGFGQPGVGVWDGGWWKDPTGTLQLDVPKGFSIGASAGGLGGAAMFAGDCGGAPCTIQTLSVPTYGMQMDDSMVAKAVAQMPQAMGQAGNVSTVRVQGRDRYSVVVDNQADGMRGQLVVFLGSDSLAMVLIQAPVASFDATAKFRQAFFEQRVRIE